MTQTETACIACGTKLKEDKHKGTTARVLLMATEGLFWASCATAAVSMFFSMGPPAKGSAMVAVLLRVLKSSASQMVEKTD